MSSAETRTVTGNPLPKVDTRQTPIWLIAISILLPTSFAMLATSATNVAIPYIAGYFGSTVDEANWVITIYMIANAILIPLTGWLENYMGRVLFLKVFITIFTIGSLICAMASSLNMLVLGRLIQGIGGGPMMPISQAILIASFPYNKRGQAMALFGLAVMVFSPCFVEAVLQFPELVLLLLQFQKHFLCTFVAEIVYVDVCPVVVYYELEIPLLVFAGLLFYHRLEPFQASVHGFVVILHVSEAVQRGGSLEEILVGLFGIVCVAAVVRHEHIDADFAIGLEAV